MNYYSCEFNEKVYKYFSENYELIYEKKLINGEKIYLGHSNNKVCRFCGNKEPDVTFKKLAHAIPHLLGNNTLFSNYECDTCNEHFSKVLENDLAAFIGPLRLFMNVKGKKGYPKYKKENTKIFLKNNIINIETLENNENIKFNEEKKEFSIETEKDSYTPIAVYKCFIKMMLSIVPESEIKNIKWVFEWILEEEHLNSNYENKPLILFSSLKKNSDSHEDIQLITFRRKKIFDYKVPFKENNPYMIFIISFKNLSFQVSINVTDEEYNMGIYNRSFRLVPLALMNKNECKKHDLSSKVRLRKEKSVISFGYKEKEEII